MGDTIVFRTLNSVYELDPDRWRVRRLAGRHVPTPRQGADGDWADYLAVRDITLGQPVEFHWGASVDADGHIVEHRTVTSAVIWIGRVDDPERR